MSRTHWGHSPSHDFFDPLRIASVQHPNTLLNKPRKQSGLRLQIDVILLEHIQRGRIRMAIRFTKPHLLQRSTGFPSKDIDRRHILFFLTPDRFAHQVRKPMFRGNCCCSVRCIRTRISVCNRHFVLLRANGECRARIGRGFICRGCLRLSLPYLIGERSERKWVGAGAQSVHQEGRVLLLTKG